MQLWFLGITRTVSNTPSILEGCGCSISVLIRPTVYVSPNAILNPRCIIKIFVVVERYAELGKAVILNMEMKGDYHCVIS